MEQLWKGNTFYIHNDIITCFYSEPSTIKNLLQFPFGLDIVLDVWSLCNELNDKITEVLILYDLIEQNYNHDILMKVNNYNPLILSHIYTLRPNRDIQNILKTTELSYIQKYNIILELGNGFFNENEDEMNQLCELDSAKITPHFSALLKSDKIILNDELNVLTSAGSDEFRYACVENFPLAGKFKINYEIVEGDNWLSIGSAVLPIKDLEPWGSHNLSMYICGPMYGLYPGGVLYSRGSLVREDLSIASKNMEVLFDMDKNEMEFFVSGKRNGKLNMGNDLIYPCIILYSLKKQVIKISIDNIV